MNEIINYVVNSGVIHANPLAGIRDVFKNTKLYILKRYNCMKCIILYVQYPARDAIFNWMADSHHGSA